MYSSRYISDYFYRNHGGKFVCYQFNFKKRVKGKVRVFLKSHPSEGELQIFLKEVGLKIGNRYSSNKYLKYDIVDCDLKKKGR